MEFVCDRKQCTGCGVCRDACAIGCIEMRYDENGFLQSYVDESRCVNCGKCVSVCPVHHRQNNHTVLESYKLQRKDREAVLSSTSGGAAALLAEKTVSAGGVVCGCGFDENLTLRHSVATDKNQLERFKGSKYVQSNTAGIYAAAKKHLKAGTEVLFIGTPCQVSGLKAFLGKDYENLTTVDLVCHGVASQKILDRYLSQEKEPVLDVKFRTKHKGYLSCQKNDLILVCKDGKKEIHHETGIVLWFASGLSLRESCYACPFSELQRCADITLADYVGDDITADDRQYGVSMVLANTEKGIQRIQALSEQAVIEKKPKQQSNYYARQPRKTPRLRKQFFKDLDRLPLQKMVEKYTLKKILPGKLTLYSKAAWNRVKRLIKLK